MDEWMLMSGRVDVKERMWVWDSPFPFPFPLMRGRVDENEYEIHNECM